MIDNLSLVLIHGALGVLLFRLLTMADAAEAPPPPKPRAAPFRRPDAR